MSAVQTQRPANALPAGVLVAAAALIAFTMGAALFARTSGIGRLEPSKATPYRTLQLRFEDKPNGGVDVRDASRDEVLFVVQPGSGGFLRATLRTLAQARKRDAIGAATPFRLIRWSDGTLSLDDPTTGRTVGLDSFGLDNAAAFGQFFKQPEDKQ